MNLLVFLHITGWGWYFSILDCFGGFVLLLCVAEANYPVKIIVFCNHLMNFASLSLKSKIIISYYHGKNI